MKNNSRKQATHKANSRQANGSTNGAPLVTLVVDNFDVRYIGKEHVMHLIKVLKEHYKVEEDWEGKQYLGITLDWDFKNHEVHLSMPEYVERALA